MKKITAPRNEFGYDLVRIWAMFSVIALHFFLYSGFYKLNAQGIPTIFYTMIRMLFYQCVPLFLMLTGALKRNASFDGRHYVKLTPIIINSLIVGGIVIAYKILYLEYDLPLIVWLQSMWKFNQPDYGWYINLYISLFLFIPFINAAYNSLKTRKQKFASVLICIFVTMFAISVNRIKLPSEDITTIGFVPNFYSGMWSLGYYVTGMYIAEFRPKVNKLMCGLMLFFMLMFQACLNYITTPDIFYNGITFNNEDFVNVGVSTMIFLLLYDIKIENIPVRRIAAEISSLSMTVYLISWIGDNYFYSRYRTEFGGFETYPLLFLKIVPLNFILCILASLVINKVVRMISQLIMRPLFRLCDKNKPPNETKKESISYATEMTKNDEEINTAISAKL